MTKIMLVEDDNNLREIYEARLVAEGYDIVSAQDGEAALAMAAREHPDLIITDVMMPKISGFEMLDILRNTEALRDVKVIMLTALGQAEDNARAGALGADRYLVKSQVTLEDIIKAAHEVLEGAAPGGGSSEQDAAAVAAPGTVTEPVAAAEPAATYTSSEPVSFSEAPSELPDVPSELPAPEQPTTSSSADGVPDDLTFSGDTITLPADPIAPSYTATGQPAVFDGGPSSTDLLDERPSASETSQAQPAVDEESRMNDQIEQFLDANADNQSEATSTLVINPPEVAERPEDEIARDEATPDMGELSVQEPEITTDQTSVAEPIPGLTPEMATAPAPAQPTASEQPPAAEPVAYATPAADTGVVAAPPAEPVTMTAEPVSAPAEPAAPAIPAPAAAPLAAPTATPGYPSQPFTMPTTPAQAAGDQLVSDAVNTMIASTPDALVVPIAAPVAQAATEPTADQPAPTPPAADVNPAASPAEQPVQTAPAPAVQTNGDQPSHRRVIAPLPGQGKPDINQLLAMEDAKVAAAQAGAQAGSQPAAPAQPPTAAPAPATAPGQATPTQTVAPTQPGNQPPLDPNSVAM